MLDTTAKQWHAESAQAFTEGADCIPGEDGYYLAMGIVCARAAQRREALDLMARVALGDRLEALSPAPRLSTDAAFGTESVINYHPWHDAHEGRVL